MKDKDKKHLRPRIVQLGPESLQGKESLDSAKFNIDKSVTITQSTIIRAPVERCFEFVNKQLEETPNWDPIIKWVNPISIKHVRVGSMSRVTFEFRGVTEVATAMIRSFHPNKSIFWTSTHSSQLQEQWSFQPEPHGTVVTVTLGYEPGGWALGHFMDKITTKKKVEKVVLQMLSELRVAVERQA